MSGIAYAATPTPTGVSCKDSAGNQIASVKTDAECCQRFGALCPDGTTKQCYGRPCPDGSVAGAGAAPTAQSLQFCDKIGLGSLCNSIGSRGMMLAAGLVIVIIVIALFGRGRR